MKKFLIVLIGVFAVLIFVSCQNKSEQQSDSNNMDAKNEVADENNSEAEPEIVEVLPEGADYGGHVFNMRSYDENEYTWNYVNLDVEAQNGDVLDDAMYIRNRKIEEKLNIEIKFTAIPNAGNLPAEITKLTQSGIHEYDAVFMRYLDIPSIISNRIALELQKLNYVDFSKPWWNESSVRDLSISNKVYTADSDIGYASKDDIWVAFFNKKLISDLELENPYNIVKNGDWTMDKMKEMSRAASQDLNGDGVIGKDDRYGILTNEENIVGLLNSCGLKLAVKDSDDLPVIEITDARFQDVFMKIKEFMTEGDDIHSAYDHDAFQRPIFLDNRGLFMTEILKYIRDFRVMDADFGVVPLPKYTKADTTYYSYIALSSPLLIVPAALPEDAYEKTGVILEALAAEGYRTMRPAYIEKSIQGKFARDEESIESLEMIIENAVYDIGCVYNWGSMAQNLKNIANNKNSTKSLAAYIESDIDKINAEMQKFIENIVSPE
ncbi:MAG: hypothetical protein FWG34_10945 [Oscillospiraceae bacterium]|nr:hypothetical protein [Oscillospiraceae bacterium]